MKEVVVSNMALQPKLDSMTGKSGSDVTMTAIIGISLFAYILVVQLKEANAKIEDLELAIADANNEWLENCGNMERLKAELQSKEHQVNQMHVLRKELNEANKERTTQEIYTMFDVSATLGGKSYHPIHATGKHLSQFHQNSFTWLMVA